MLQVVNCFRVSDYEAFDFGLAPSTEFGLIHVLLYLAQDKKHCFLHSRHILEGAITNSLFLQPNSGIRAQALVNHSESLISACLLKTTGPSNSWTIHGLWPDHCDGTFDSSCDPSRAYTNISQILQSFGKTDLLSYMNTYWVDIDGDNESFWEHEWGKHGTCISTLKPSCYTGYTATQEVADFFQKTVDLFKTLDSYTVLDLFPFFW
jgi:hypothetical protein